MSGGFFNYNQHNIDIIINDLEYYLKSNEYKNEKESLKPETLDKIKEGKKILKQAYIYAQRIDWFLSGDDSEETFHKRLKEDLENLDE